MLKKFEGNQTKIKGSSQSETKAAELISTSELSLITAHFLDKILFYLSRYAVNDDY